MAIYEVGNCFEHAWGVPGTKRNQPNHQMAAMYYRLGAEQGDRDNQERKHFSRWYFCGFGSSLKNISKIDLANLLSQGKYGLKKDM
jgi:TPR repeat protein